METNGVKPNNEKQLTVAKPRYTGEQLARLHPKIYRRVANYIAEGWSNRKIIRDIGGAHHYTIEAVRKRESTAIEARKKQLVSLYANVAQISGERVEELVAGANVSQAMVCSGIAADKMLAILGQTPVAQIAVVNMPTEAERAERRQMHDKLDDIARRLALPPA